ncbi:MAG TPA: hypothetical protein VMS22_21280 [Candidatus Eisenbacteria bacterium]|nr:hypothetical protein [Candidatus Eisenbacteria bacterium]
MRLVASALLVLLATVSRIPAATLACPDVGPCENRIVVLSCRSGAPLVRGQLLGRRSRALPTDLIRCRRGDAGTCVFTWRNECPPASGACDDSFVSVDRGSLVTLGDATTTVVFRCRLPRSSY